MTILDPQIIERLSQLPPERVAEVVDFVEFLAQREERLAASRQLGDSLARIDSLNMPPVSEDDIAAEVQAARTARRAMYNS
jgi:Protein of unknown function (DUF2281)